MVLPAAAAAKKLKKKKEDDARNFTKEHSCVIKKGWSTYQKNEPLHEHLSDYLKNYMGGFK